MTDGVGMSKPNEAFRAPENPPPYEEHPSHAPGQILIHQPGQVPTIINAVVVKPVGSIPTPITCNLCRAEIITRVQFMPSTRTHLVALLLCIVGCWPFACLPYCIDSCNRVDHYCPNCNSYVGSYQN